MWPVPRGRIRLHRLLRAVDDRAQVDLELARDARLRLLLERRDRHDPGVVDDDVDRPQPALDVVEEGAEAGEVGHVERQADDRVAELGRGAPPRPRGRRRRSRRGRPSRSGASVIARPMPRAPPVTTAVLPLSERGCLAMLVSSSSEIDAASVNRNGSQIRTAGRYGENGPTSPPVNTQPQSACRSSRASRQTSIAHCWRAVRNSRWAVSPSSATRARAPRSSVRAAVVVERAPAGGPGRRAASRSRGSGSTSSSWPPWSIASTSAPWAAPRTARSTASVSGEVVRAARADLRGHRDALRHAGGGDRGVQLEPEPGVGAHGPRVRRGEDHAAARAVRRTRRPRASSSRPAPSPWASGSTTEQRQAPEALAQQRQRDAGDRAVALGHPRAAGIRLQQPAQAQERDRRIGRRRGVRGAEAAIEVLERAPVDVVDGGAGRPRAWGGRSRASNRGR